MQQTMSLQPTEEARQTGAALVGATDLQRTVLAETIASGERGRLVESGRSVCGGQRILRPLQRNARSVMLADCPPGGGEGFLHAHITKRGLTTSEHSLVDMSVVFLTDTEASLVVGAQESDLCLAPQSPAEAAGVLSDVLGVEVRTPFDVLGAIGAGHIPNPPDARRRIRSALPQLFESHQTPFPDLADRILRLSIPMGALVDASHDHDHYDVDADADAEEVDLELLELHQPTMIESHPDRLRRMARESGAALRGLFAGVDLRDAVSSHLVSRVVEAVIDDVV